MNDINKATDFHRKHGMAIPQGKTCSDCYAFNYCEALFGCDPKNEFCDWAPSRFRPRVVKQ